jgi:hypothetical protein
MWGTSRALLIAATALAAAGAVGLVGGCVTVGAGGEPDPAPRVYRYVEMDSYAFTVRINCFCPDAGVPIRVTVEDGKAVDGVYLEDPDGPAQAGDQSAAHTWITLNDVIAVANDTRPHSVSVQWPPGARWPDSVDVDLLAGATDDNYGYVITDVREG